MPKRKRIFYVMGVSGTGKTTIGKLLAERLKIEFFDGDDFHPEENVAKMSAGKPLNDDDRYGWLERLNDLAIAKKNDGAVIACSALKQKYRTQLCQDLDDKAVFVYLEGTFEEIKERMESRKGHFMPISLLKSQFEAMEPPKEAIAVRISQTPAQIVQQVIRQI